MMFTALVDLGIAAEKAEIEKSKKDLEKRIRYLQAETGYPSDVPDLPDGSQVMLTQFGVSIVLPYGTEREPWDECFKAAGYHRAEYSKTEWVHSDAVQVDDGTGHHQSTNYYHTVTITVAAKPRKE